MKPQVEAIYWYKFLREWGLTDRRIRVSELRGGLINDNYLLDTGATRYVVRHYRRTTKVDNVLYELGVVDYLGRCRFPTARVVRSCSGRLFGLLEGRPVAVFEFISGEHPKSRSDGFGSFDLDLGCQVARLLSKLHILTWGKKFPGRRDQRGDPLERIEQFLRQDSRLGMRSNVDGIERFTESLHQTVHRLADATRGVSADALPIGVVHNDVNLGNVLTGATGQPIALLDFDDCIESYRIYDLCSIISTWGLGAQRQLDLKRTRSLIASYDTCRRLTPVELTLIPDFLMCYFGAAGSEYLTGLHRQRLLSRDVGLWVGDSYSARTFLGLYEDDDLRRNIQGMLMSLRRGY